MALRTKRSFRGFRLVRAPGVPSFIADKLLGGPLPRSIPFVLGKRQFEVRYRRGGFIYAAGDKACRYRQTFAVLMDGDALLAGMEFVEVRADPTISPDHFFWSLDAESAGLAELAGVLCMEWKDCPLGFAEFGDVLEFVTAWGSRAAPPELWKHAADVLLARLFASHSILLMKAFPLEYEGLLPVGSPYLRRFEFRRRAMIRHYAKLFGVAPLPGPPGKEGWLWRPAPDVSPFIQRPRYSRRNNPLRRLK